VGCVGEPLEQDGELGRQDEGVSTGPEQAGARPRLPGDPGASSGRRGSGEECPSVAARQGPVRGLVGGGVGRPAAERGLGWWPSRGSSGWCRCWRCRRSTSSPRSADRAGPATGRGRRATQQLERGGSARERARSNRIPRR
jgi:hypothetical protein